MTHMMDRFFRGVDAGRLAFGEAIGTGEFMPRVDVRETDEAIQVTAELPGMDEKDIDISLSHEALTLKGEKKEESEEKNKDHFHVERRYGSFQRTIPLPAEIDEGKVEAEFKKGLLRITLPKSPSAQQSYKKIPIKGQ
jgi:HSP20 family protein